MSLESLLREADGTGREELLRQALEVELSRRVQRGEKPRREEYFQRFPDQAEVIAGVFDEPPGTGTEESLTDSPGESCPRMLGKFQVIGRLGSGSQGSALLARDPDLGRLVVLKRYDAPAGIRGDDGVRWDGQAISRLRSRYVPQSYDIERIDGELILVMEYIPGRNLREVTRSSRLGLAAAARIIEQVAEGLEAVHACGLVHRDIKPENIVMGEDHVPRLVDFGLAAHLGSPALGSVTGTPPYMAPEQARGQSERIDGRTDLYGLGSVLYAMLTGQPPHPGSTSDESLEHARNGLVLAPRAVNRSVPRDLERIVLKTLEPDPTLRYATASELRRALRRRRLSRRYGPVGLSVGFLLAAAAFLALVHHLVDKRENQPVPPLSIAAQPLIKVERSGHEFPLEEVVPLVTGDKLWIECDLPGGWQASAFWFDTEGRLTELLPVKIVRGKVVDRLSYPPDDAITVIGPPGTELIFICARPSLSFRQSEVAAMLPMGKPLSILNSTDVAWVDRERVTLSSTFEHRLRGPGSLSASTAREALKSLQEVRQRLGSKIEYIIGVAFAHAEPRSLTEGSEPPAQALGSDPSSDHKEMP
jgi:hypothetical protein